MLRAIKDIKPRWVVGENVSGILNWSDGMVFEQVCADLEAAGFKVQTVVLPACGVNAPHRRDRVWFVANANDNGFKRGNGKSNRESKGETDSKGKRTGLWNESVEHGVLGASPNTKSSGRKTRTEGSREKQPGGRNEPMGSRQWHGFPTQPPVCSGNDELSTRLDGITLPKWRRESIKAYGNAIVPAVALQIFKAIEEIESNHKKQNYEQRV